MTSKTPSSDEAIDRLRESWRGKNRLSAEELLKQHPQLADDPNSAVDVIYAEILLREEHGERPSKDEYCRRFPQYYEPLSRQFQLHGALGHGVLGPVGPAPAATTTYPKKTLPASPESQPAAHSLKVPGFEIHEVVGRGGSGVAYRATDTTLKRSVAIKFLQAAGDEHHKYLLREAEAAAALVHPNIVQVHQIGDVQATPFLVMEFIDGESLASRLQQGPLPASEAADMLNDVALAIQFAHENNIVHRDLKPGNVLLDRSNSPHVCDFGLARKLDSEFTLHATGDVVGTPAYMAPEQARGESATTAADVYSLGAMLYHSLTGRPPFQAATPWEILNQVMADEPVSVCSLNAAIPKDLDTICTAAMHKVPYRRIQSAGDFAAELRRFKAGEPIHSRPVGRFERAWKLCRRNPAVAGMITVSVLALAAVAIVSVLSQQEISSALKQTQTALLDAKTQRDVAFEAMDNLVHKVHDDLEKHEASVEARGEVLHSAIEGLQKIIDTGDSDPQIIMTMAEAHTQYGFILAQQGQNQAATAEYELAVAITESVEGDAARKNHALNLALLASQHLRNADLKSGLDVSQRAVEEFDILAGEFAEDLPLQLNSFAARKTLGESLIALDRRDEGLGQLEKARSAVREFLNQSADHQIAKRTLIEINMSVATECFAVAKVERAEAALEEAISFIEADPVGIDSDTQLYRDYLICCQLSGISKYSHGQYKEAIAAYSVTKEGYERLIEKEPTRPGFPLKLGVVSGYLATCHIAINELAEAEKHVQVAITQFTRGMELGGPEYRVQRSAIAGALGQRVDLQLRAGDVEAASVTVAQIEETLRPLVEKYQLQSMQTDLLFRGELLKGLAGIESNADPNQVEVTRRSYLAWQNLFAGDVSEFEECEPQLLADIAAAQHPIVKSSLVFTMALSRGQYFQRLSANADSSPERLKTAEAKAIESIKTVIAAPGSDPKFYLGAPEFTALGQTEAFRAAFDSK
ncbi:MAG: serine/threonine-protein kinase [Fuerstiella sp.]